MNVLSLFDGISCGAVALHKAGIEVTKYISSEIDKKANIISAHNHPDIIRVGDVTKLSYKDGYLTGEMGTIYVGVINLLIGGSPCQSISNLGDKSGLKGTSSLFFHYKRLQEETKVKWWLLENVEGNKKAIESISKFMGCSPLKINSNTLSAQNRKRLYWTNIPGVEQPKDLGINLIDVLQKVPSPESALTTARLSWLIGPSGQKSVEKKYTSINAKKAACLTARSDASWNCNYIESNGVYRKLSCIEYERLQCLPDDYTNVKGVTPSARYKALGNGWTVDVIAHIFSYLPKEV